MVRGLPTSNLLSLPSLNETLPILKTLPTRAIVTSAAIENNWSRAAAASAKQRHHFRKDVPVIAISRAVDKMPKYSTKGRDKGQQPKKRDTHFLCLPLVTPNSVPQLAKSLSHFRDITVPQDHADEDEEGGRGNESPDRSSNVSNFKIVPQVAHRPPGTFHLTIGVMDLSDQSEMDRALKLLQDIDYTKILKEVSDGANPDTASKRGYTPSLLTSESMSAGQRSGDRTEDERQAADSRQRTLSECQSDGHEKAEAAEPHKRTQNLVSLNKPISPPASGPSSLPSSSTTDIRVATVPSPEPITSSSTVSGPEEPENPNSPEREALSINLTGLGTFPSPQNARVFYAKPQDHTGRLLPFAQSIRRIFRTAGFITETRPLVLHATVANLRYAVQEKQRQSSSEGSRGRGGRGRKGKWSAEGTADARDLIKLFDSFGGDVEGLSEEPKLVSTSSSAPADGPDGGAVRENEVVNNDSGGSEQVRPPEFTWAKDVPVEMVAICKLGAEKSRDPVLGLEYPPVGYKLIC